ncbi:MAG: spore protease YyaC [Clostridiaceae bacterium]|nr:spore protease YyaC [Clostridiaceae bacterium]
MEQIKNRFFDTTVDFSKSSLLSRDCLAKTDSLNYYDITLKSDEKAFIHQIRHAKKEARRLEKNLVFLCIGSDRATGDCFGPLVGETLLYHFARQKTPASLPSVYGTLQTPVHAINLQGTIRQLQESLYDPYIVAVDASLGIREHIGYVTYSQNPLAPGIGVQKSLPHIGNASITGIVNVSGNNCHGTLQTTRLSKVIALSNFVSHCILAAYHC